MTRNDLEEIIGNLEYLLRNRIDPDHRQKYEEQLQDFRQELRALRRPEYPRDLRAA